MRKLFIATVVSMAALGATSMAIAAGHDGGAPGGSQGTHEAAINSNGMKSTDRDFGKDRAEDRAGVKSQAALNANGIKSAHRETGKAHAAVRHHRHHHHKSQHHA